MGKRAPRRSLVVRPIQQSFQDVPVSNVRTTDESRSNMPRTDKCATCGFVYSTMPGGEHYCPKCADERCSNCGRSDVPLTDGTVCQICVEARDSE